MFVHSRKREISWRSSCAGDRTHCYWGGQHTGFSLRPGGRNVIPTWGWVAAARNATGRRWALETACGGDTSLAVGLLSMSEDEEMRRGRDFETRLTLPARGKRQVPLQGQE